MIEAVWDFALEPVDIPNVKGLTGNGRITGYATFICWYGEYIVD